MRVSFEQISGHLGEGGVAAVPTETVYGLAASLHYPKAIDRIFVLKGRPSTNPLIIHVSDPSQVLQFTPSVPEHFEMLAKAFWPGAVTLVIPISTSKIPERVRAGLPTAAFRIPKHPLALELIQRIGPLVMPSANLSGRPSSTCAEHVESDFGKDFPVLDGGFCPQGVESTILMHQEGRWKIIRLGAIGPEAFQSVLGYKPEINCHAEGERPLCPGQLLRHYAPRARLTLKKEFLSEEKGTVIGFDHKIYPQSCRLISLGEDPEQAARNLYQTLRKLDLEGIKEAYVDIDIPDEGLWLTLKERLQKAASR